MRYAVQFEICNRGDITLLADFESISIAGSFHVQLPKRMQIGPNSTVICNFYIVCNDVGEFVGSINVVTTEEILAFGFKGISNIKYIPEIRHGYNDIFESKFKKHIGRNAFFGTHISIALTYRLLFLIL